MWSMFPLRVQSHCEWNSVPIFLLDGRLKGGESLTLRPYVALESLELGRNDEESRQHLECGPLKFLSKSFETTSGRSQKLLESYSIASVCLAGMGGGWWCEIAKRSFPKFYLFKVCSQRSRAKVTRRYELF